MEVEATWTRALMVWWAYTWRAIAAMVVGVLILAIVSVVDHSIASLLGSRSGPFESVRYLLALSLSVVASIVPIKLILGKDFGEFRLALIRTDRFALGHTLEIEKRDPSEALLHLQKAYDFYERGKNLDQVMHLCEMAIFLNPDIAEAHYLRGVILEDMNRSDEAILAFGKAVEINPEYSDARLALEELRKG